MVEFNKLENLTISMSQKEKQYIELIDQLQSEIMKHKHKHI